MISARLGRQSDIALARAAARAVYLTTSKHVVLWERGKEQMPFVPLLRLPYLHRLPLARHVINHPVDVELFLLFSRCFSTFAPVVGSPITSFGANAAAEPPWGAVNSPLSRERGVGAKVLSTEYFARGICTFPCTPNLVQRKDVRRGGTFRCSLFRPDE